MQIRTQRRFIPVLLFVAGMVARPALAADCATRIAAKGSGSRTVAFAGGDGWVLMQTYLSQVKQRELDVSPWKIQVVLQMSGKQQNLELGWGKMLTGESPEKIWERTLSGKRAELSTALLAQAASSNWDLVCVGPPVDTTLKPVVKPKPKPDRRPDPQMGLDGQAPSPTFGGDALIYFKSGVQYAANRDYKNALREFKEAEMRDRRFPGLLMNIGVAYMQQGDYVRAADYLTRAVEQNPRDPSTHLNMACLQARLGQPDDAIASLASAKANGQKMSEIRNDRDLAVLRGRRDFEALFRSKEK
jgi:hypothetical protein